jgi:hypothetical protein
MPNYSVEFNPFFGSPDHVPRYNATSNFIYVSLCSRRHTLGPTETRGAMNPIYFGCPISSMRLCVKTWFPIPYCAIDKCWFRPYYGKAINMSTRTRHNNFKNDTSKHLLANHFFCKNENSKLSPRRFHPPRKLG